MAYDNTTAIDRVPWQRAPKSDSGRRAFARRHGFYPTRSEGGWAIFWSSCREISLPSH